MESAVHSQEVIKLSDQEFRTLTEFLRRDYGINLSKKRTLIEGRMNAYLQRNGFSSYSAYMQALFGDTTGSEITNILNVLTTNYSYFMREWAHFEFYRKTILPEVKAASADRDLRVWSAGCSTGQEPYTLAMIADDFFGSEGAAWDKRVLATDISEKVLETGQVGIYGADEIEDIPPKWKKQYFSATADGRVRVKQELRDEIIFRKFNLMEREFPFKKKFHVIFCRNVMIYFDAQTKRELVEKFVNALAPGGYLIVGHSEFIDRASMGLAYVTPSVYRKGNANGC